MTVSDFILKTLECNGVGTIFGLPGVHALGMWNSLRHSSIEYVGFRHEQAAAHAADGAGRATGAPGVVLLSTGPGELNALSALGEAFTSSSPVIAIASQIPTRFLGKQKGYLHESRDLLEAAGTVSRYCARATAAAEVPELLSRGLKASLETRHGPAFLEIPMDLFDQELDVEPERVPLAETPLPHDSIEEAALLLSLAARPVIWAGGGVVRSGAAAELTAVAEILRAPVVTTFMGKGAISEAHPLCVGALVRQPEVRDLLRDSDLMLAVGTRFSAMTTGNWDLQLPHQLIHVDIDPEEIGRNYPVRLGIQADARVSLRALEQALTEGSSRRGSPAGGRAQDDSWPEGAQTIRRQAFTRARSEGHREISMIAAIRGALPPTTPMFHDMTIPSYWAAPFMEVTESRTFHYPYGFGSLGFSFPASLGAAAAMRPQRVVCFTGDGGFQYHLRELATAKQHELDVTVLLFNDQAWGVLKAFSSARYDHDLGMDLPGPDFVKLVEAYGIPVHRASDPDHVSEVVGRSLAQPGPTVIEVPGSWGLPPPSDYYR